MSTTVVRCNHQGCQEQAAYKIAAAWSDGVYAELKSYGYACQDHLGPVYREAQARKQTSPTAPNETVEDLGIYKYEQGKRDRQLQRLWGLEENYRA